MLYALCASKTKLLTQYINRLYTNQLQNAVNFGFSMVACYINSFYYNIVTMVQSPQLQLYTHIFCVNIIKDFSSLHYIKIIHYSTLYHYSIPYNGRHHFRHTKKKKSNKFLTLGGKFMMLIEMNFLQKIPTFATTDIFVRWG